MDCREKALRVGLSAMLCAVILRLFAGGLAGRAAAFLARPEMRAFLFYLETGRDVRSSLSEDAMVFSPESPEPVNPSPPPTEPETSAPEQEATQPEEGSEEPETSAPEQEATQPEEGSEEPVEFTREDAEGVAMYYGCDLRPDVKALLLSPSVLPRSESGPRVLIYSTHSTESYTPGEEVYAESAAYRTLDGDYNMLSVGGFVAQRLEELGVETLVDDSVHDYPSYNGAYGHARKSIRSLLAEYPSVQLVLDLHRDASDTAAGQLRTLAAGGEDCAQLMLVMGSDAGGLKHDHWQENLSLALKLQVLLERLHPGITRPVCLRAQRFNQDLSPGCLLVEIGAAGNTRAEALQAADVLARGVAELLKTIDGT